MTARNAAMMMAGSAAVASSTAAALVIWLLLMRPIDVARAANGQDIIGLATLAAETLYGMLLRLLELI
jgi:hypothetical protein